MARIEAEPKPESREIVGKNGMVLRRFAPYQAEAIHFLIQSDPDHLNANHQHIAEKYPTVESVLKSIEQPKNPERRRFGIWPGALMVGSVNIEPELGAPVPTAEVGYWIAKKYEGQGFVSRAMRSLVAFAFDELGTERLIAKVATNNARSGRLVGKLGFRLALIGWEQDEFTSEKYKSKTYELWRHQPDHYPPVRVE